MCCLEKEMTVQISVKGGRGCRSSKDRRTNDGVVVEAVTGRGTGRMSEKEITT